MNFAKHIERIKKAHQLIYSEKTGKPEAFAVKLRISRSQLYNELDFFKSLKAVIKYSKKTESFYYAEPFDLEISYTLKIITDKEEQQIFGGMHFRPILLDGSAFNLFQQKSSRENLFVG
ncbi:hypothetical protein [Flavobacterium sp.]|uniref:hypothetical protein n=1 Tax=Flavobacterium sp. TaxID=239 RepID=UPI002BBCE222|nr:hypothetical protein [Flavobacterium sp.]HSD08874.1 hypothetical protein [Flavobacterium sp.]